MCTSLGVLKSTLRPMVLLPRELQFSKDIFTTTEASLNRSLRAFGEGEELGVKKVDEYNKPVGTIKGRLYLASSRKAWPK